MEKNIEKIFFFNSFYGFTLAEVIITIGIIGILATATIPILINKTQEIEFKSAYKKAYSNLSQAFTQAISESSLTSRTAKFDAIATASEWDLIKNTFKVEKECTSAQLNNCWVDGDKVCTGSCGGNNPKINISLSFIDSSGSSWAQYQSDENIYLVDVNGSKSPNKFGKDRWLFTLKDVTNSRVSVGLPAKVGIYIGDQIVQSDWCNYPPCYYKSWLFDN